MNALSSLLCIDHLRKLLGEDVLLLAWPKGSKGTRRLWGHLTAAKDMSDPEYLHKLDNAGNIGVALGSVSGGLCSIDIDDDGLVEPFLQKNPMLRDTLQTKAARGCNFWVRIEGEYPGTHHIKQDGVSIGEFRSENNQTIISGTHPDGPTYQVLNPAKPVAVTFGDLWFPPGTARSPRQAWKKADGATRTERTERTEENKGDSSSPRRLASVSLKGLLLMAKPSRKHTNHNCLFLLARGVLALEEERGKCYSRAELRDVFNQWYAAAKPYVRENLTSDDYFMEFLELCDYANTPLGSGTVDLAWELAQSEPLPPEAEQFDSLEYKLLTALCWHLQRLAGAEPFYLSTRTVQRVCGLETHTQAARRLRMLVRFEVLEEVEKGGPHTNKATRFRYVLAPNPS